MYLVKVEDRRERRDITATSKSKQTNANKTEKTMQGYYDMMIKQEVNQLAIGESEPVGSFRHKPYCCDIGIKK